MIITRDSWTCPACGKPVGAQFALEPDPEAIPEMDNPDHMAIQIPMKLTGTRISHDCIPKLTRSDPDRLARARAAAEASGVDPDAPLEEPDSDLMNDSVYAVERADAPVRQDVASTLPRGMVVYGNPRDPDPYSGHSPQREDLLR